LHETLATQPAGSYIAPDARVDPRATLHAPYYIGAGSRIDAEAEVGPYASVEAGVRIGRGSQLQHCQVLPYTRVGAGGRWAHGLLYPHGFTAWEGAGTPEDAGEMLNSTWQEPWNEKLHTWFDQVFAAVLLFLSAPVWLLIITAIKLDSPGPAFYTQLRRGQDPRPYRLGSPRGEVFACYKFRTMHADADRRLQELRARNQYGQGAFFKLADDPRITRVGVFLRKTSLDELPQLINVLKGEMRLVGNRPLPLYEAEALREDWQRTRFLAPAGITGLWQISGRSDLSEKERLVLDTYYSVTRSFWGDWGILLRTVPALIRQRGAR
jgi:lipopolysaccharide/colanic/teichoic acid biosynthesis glycosyltransferase